MYMATSAALAKHSHGVGIERIVETARPIIQRVKDAGLEVRFSCEDTFRSNTHELLEIYAAIDKLGVNRVGLADTVGVATPTQVLELTRAVRKVLRPETGIEFHTHNDTGCAIANALMALEGGATHINTCILGIGERNGITPLGGFLARLYTLDKDAIKKRYDLNKVDHLEKYVAHVCGIKVPFNNYVTGAFAFTHKAGVHTKAIMNDPSSYEVINPEDFGVQRHVELAHRLTGWNALNNRAQSLGLDVSEDQIKAATTLIKNLADERTVTMDHVDSVLIQLATGPKSTSSQFLKWSADRPDAKLPDEVRKAAEQAAKAMEAFEKAQAAAAVANIKDAMVDTRPSLVVRMTGHLFDKAVLNRAMDVLVDGDMDFQFLNIDVPATNEGKTKADIRVWAKDENDLAKVKKSMMALCQAMSDIADTTIDLIDATGAPKDGRHFG